MFVRSGIRYDYMLCDKSGDFFAELVRYHISGQLKVAPEHCIDYVLDYMGKPHIDVYERFMERYKKLNQRYDKEQYVVPYLMSSHPGSTLKSAVALAEFLHRTGRRPEQVQGLLPHAGHHLHLHVLHRHRPPRDMSEVYVARSAHEKAMQRALLQYTIPANRHLVIEALRAAGREDLIGYGKHCLVRPERPNRAPCPVAIPAARRAHPGARSRPGRQRNRPKTQKSPRRSAGERADNLELLITISRSTS